MGATIRWCDKDKTVLYYGLNGSWNKDKFYTTMTTLWQGIVPISHKVDLIVDLRACMMQIDERATDIDLLPQWCPPNLDTVIVVGAKGPIYNVYGAFMWHNAHDYISINIRAMNTPEAAMSYLKTTNRSKRSEHA